MYIQIYCLLQTNAVFSGRIAKSHDHLTISKNTEIIRFNENWIYF
jgi:hypothetical protein